MDNVLPGSVRSVPHQIAECAVAADHAGINFSHCKPQVIANIVGCGSVAARVTHQYTQPARFNRPACESQRNVSAVSVSDYALGKISPRARRIQGDIADIIKIAILHLITTSEGIVPDNSHSVDGLRLIKFDYDPLGVKQVLFAGEMPIEVRIAFPERQFIAIINARITGVGSLIDRITAARQAESIGKRNRFAKIRVRGPVSLLLSRVAPAPIGIPMPDV